nr:site-specific tyrosine recombinase/integron integrase [uncultured Draconibacterium sp.]
MNYKQRFIDELELRNYSQNSIASYASILESFLAYFPGDPAEVEEERIKAWLKSSSSQSLLKQRIGAVKRFYQYVIKDPLKFKYIDYPRPEEHLPEVLSRDEVKRLFAACTNLKHTAIMLIFYSTGIRISELLNLKITDIDSGEMVIRIKQGKGKKDRLVPLSEKTLVALRKYWRKHKPSKYLFNGQFSDRYSETSIRNFIKKYAEIAGISKKAYPHLLRHTNATHLYENNTDMAVIQDLMGHKSQKTTRRYARISTRVVSKVVTPDCFIS